MTRDKNFSRRDTPGIIDTEYEFCNFSQVAWVDDGLGRQAGTRIFPGDDTPRTFRSCNLVNCIVPPGSAVINCNTALNKYDPDSGEALENHGLVDPDSLAVTYRDEPVVFEAEVIP